MYGHRLPSQSYENYNQPLAHPLGSNFVESISFLRYRKKRLYFEGELMYAVQGLDTLGVNWGGDIYKDNYSYVQEYGNKITQGVKANTLYFNIKTGYIINPTSF